MFRIALSAILFVGCAASAQTAPPEKEEAAETMPLTTLNEFLSTYHADVGSSVKLADGRVLWFFGDTWTPESFERNSLVVQTGETFTRRAGTFLKPVDADHLKTWYWPGQAIAPTRELVHVLMQKFIRTGDGAWDWRYLSTDLVTLRQMDLSVKRVIALPDSARGANWSQMFYEEKTALTYVYGAYQVGIEGQKAYDALISPALIRPQWAVKTGAFSPDLELGHVVSVVQVGNGDYRAYSKRLDMWSEEIVMYRGDSPTGPWFDRKVIATTPVPTGCWTYGVEAHPHIPAITYATNCGRLDSSYHLTAIEFVI